MRSPRRPLALCDLQLQLAMYPPLVLLAPELVATNRSEPTNFISLAEKPGVVAIVVQPPSIVVVDDLFTVQVPLPPPLPFRCAA